MDFRTLIPLALTGFGAAASVVTWISAGFPPFATRAYVDSTYWMVKCPQLRDRLMLDQSVKFQWEQNPQPYSPGVQQEIDTFIFEIKSIQDELKRSCS